MPPAVRGGNTGDIIRGIAITSLIFILSAYTPVIGVFFSLFIPLPTLFYRSKLGKKDGAVVPAASAVIIAFMLGQASFETLFFAELLLLGFTLGELIKKNLSVEQTVLWTAGVIMGTGSFVLILYGNMVSTGLTGLLSDYISRNLELALVLYKNMGMSEENIRIISESLEAIRYMMVRLLPALAASSVLFVTWINLLMIRPMLRKRRIFFPNFGSLNLWKVPEHLVWGVIGCSVLLLLPDKPIRMLGLNGLIVLMTVYFFGGIAIVSYYFEKKQMPLGLRCFVYTFIALQQLALFIVIGLGFFDMWLNFRKLKNQKE